MANLQYGPDDRIEPRWTFDDLQLGVSIHRRALSHPLATRRPDMSVQRWYNLAGEICTALNAAPGNAALALKTLEEMPLG